MLVRACDGNGTCRVQLRLYFAVEIENDCSLFARDSHVLSLLLFLLGRPWELLISRREDEKDPGKVGDNVHR